MASIFKDSDKLSPRYIPKVLPHRGEQIAMLNGFFNGILDTPSEAYLRVVQAIGPVGTGKTCSCIRFGEAMEEEARMRGVDLKYVYINLKVHGGSRVILYRHLVRQSAPEVYSKSLGAEELLDGLVRYLEAENQYLLISLDEIDYFVKHVGDRVIYDLTRLNEFYPGRPLGVLGLIFTARSKDFYELVGRAELSTLGRNCIDFPPYGVSQIVDILDQRVEEAFRRGAVSRDVFEYVADVTASPPVDGDVRYALDLLLFAGNLADRLGHEVVLPEDVRRVHGETHPHITSEDILDLPDEGKVALMAVARSLQIEESPYVSLRRIREMCGVVCEEYGLKPLDTDEHVQDLADRGIVEIKSLTKVGMSGIPSVELYGFLDNLMDRVKERLG